MQQSQEEICLFYEQEKLSMCLHMEVVYPIVSKRLKSNE